MLYSTHLAKVPSQVLGRNCTGRNVEGDKGGAMRKPVGHTIGVVNKQRVVNELRLRRRASADGLVRATGLSLPTVQKWLAELESDGYVREGGRGESTGGRPPVLYEFVSTRDFVVGLAVEIPAVSAAVMDLGGRLHRVTSTTIPTDLHPDATLALLQEHVDAITASSLPHGASPAAVAVAISGYLDTKAGLSLATPRMPQWKDVPVRRVFEDRYGVPVTFMGHIDALTVAEMAVGEVSGLSDFLFFDVGWGVGTRLVHAGELVVSAFGNSGLISHTTVVPGGRACLCGNRGCLEEYASGRALVRIANETLGLPTANASNVDELATTLLGDGAERWLEHPSINEFLDFLALGIANAINIFDIPDVVLGGYLSSTGSRVRERLTKAVKERLPSVLRTHVHLMFSSVPNDVGSAFGAAATALQFAFPYLDPVTVQPDALVPIAGKEAGQEPAAGR